jgi:CNT family concentrative nucleoside transporter
MKISINVIAMLIGFLGLIALINYLLMKFGTLFHLDIILTLDWIFGKIFSPMAWAMGVPAADVSNVATMLGKKLTINEFVAFSDLTQTMVPNSSGVLVKGYQSIISDKSLMIVSFAICGFANFSSVGMQIGGIGALVPERRADLAKLGMRALLCGTLASYLSASIAGILMG